MIANFSIAIAVCVLLACVQWWLPLALLAVAVIVLAIETPHGVALTVVGLIGVLLGKQRDPAWQARIAELGTKYDQECARRSNV